MRLIDADAVLERLCGYCTCGCHEKGEQVCIEFEEISKIPTIDPEELRPMSAWKLNKDGSGTCKRCHCTQMAVWDYDNWQNYCGHCGAKMEDAR